MNKIAVWCVIALLWVGQVQAQVGLHVTPESPVAFHSFSLHANGGGCDRFQSLDPSVREVTVQGGVIRVVVPYAYRNPCVLPPVPVTWVLPGVPAGNYHVELYGEYSDFPRALVEAIDIVVQPGPPAPMPAVVPSSSWWTFAALALGIGWVVVRRGGWF